MHPSILLSKPAGQGHGVAGAYPSYFLAKVGTPRTVNVKENHQCVLFVLKENKCDQTVKGCLALRELNQK